MDSGARDLAASKLFWLARAVSSMYRTLRSDSLENPPAPSSFGGVINNPELKQAALTGLSSNLDPPGPRRLHSCFLKLLVRSSGLDSFMLARVAYQEHAIVSA